jgi:hypothetical protein
VEAARSGTMGKVSMKFEVMGKIDGRFGLADAQIA